MSLQHLRDKAAVVGVGKSALGRNLGLDALTLMSHAFKAALDDSGLKKEEVDGLIVNTGGAECDRLPQLLGIDVQWSSQTWSHGRMSGVILEWAAMVVHAGLARNVLCIAGYSSHTVRTRTVRGGSGEAFRPGGGPHWEAPEYGIIHPGTLPTLAFQRYCHLYGYKPDLLGAVSVAQRKHASLNPDAVYRQRITLDDYKKARFVVEPLRLYDFAAVNDGAVALIVSSADRAGACRKRPVYLSGMQGMQGGKEWVIFSRTNMGVAQQSLSREARQVNQAVYRMAGVEPKDIDAVEIYDSFSPEVIFDLEDFGFCPPGEALGWIQGGRIEPKGELPVNTHGGHLSEGMLGGFNHLAEAVRQARGECGERQVPNARLVQYTLGPGVSIIFRGT